MFSLRALLRKHGRLVPLVAAAVTCARGIDFMQGQKSSAATLCDVKVRLLCDNAGGEHVVLSEGEVNTAGLRVLCGPENSLKA